MAGFKMPKIPKVKIPTTTTGIPRIKGEPGIVSPSRPLRGNGGMGGPIVPPIRKVAKTPGIKKLGGGY